MYFFGFFKITIIVPVSFYFKIKVVSVIVISIKKM